MTLSTSIIVKDPVPAEKLFRFVQSLLGDPATQRCRHVEPHGRLWRNPTWQNELGQGLPALMHVEYGADGPMVDYPDDYPDDPDREHMQGCAEVWFDTSYGYRAPNGARAGDLHAWLVTRVCAWLEDRHARYEWHDEYRDVWSSTGLDVHALGDVNLGALKHDRARTGARGQQRQGEPAMTPEEMLDEKRRIRDQQHGYLWDETILPTVEAHARRRMSWWRKLLAAVGLAAVVSLGAGCAGMNQTQPPYCSDCGSWGSGSYCRYYAYHPHC